MSEPTIPAPQATPRRLTLEVEVGVEPLSGVLRAEEADYPFSGWLSLATALERATRPRSP